MLIEFNLVKNRDIFTPVYEVIARERKEAENGEMALAHMCEFISSNVASFDAALADKSLVTKLQGIQSLTISDFYSLKFILANSGVDLLMYAVSDREVNDQEIPADFLEYNSVDYNDVFDGFIPRASKMNASSESMNMSQVYERVINAYGYFDGSITEGYLNPLKTNLDLLKQTEVALGVSPTNITSYINSVLEYLNIRLVLMTN